jgi:hypothetical protein
VLFSFHQDIITVFAGNKAGSGKKIKIALKCIICKLSALRDQVEGRKKSGLRCECIVCLLLSAMPESKIQRGADSVCAPRESE